MRALAIPVISRPAGWAQPFQRAAAALALLLTVVAAGPAAAQTGALTSPVAPPVTTPAVPAATAATAPTDGTGEPDAAVAVRDLQILAIRSDDAFEQAEALTSALKRAVQRAPGWELPVGDFSLEVLVAALDCREPPNAGCLAEIANRTRSRHFVYGSLYRIGKGVRADLHVWKAGEQKTLQLDYSDNLVEPADDALINIARLALANLVAVDAGTVDVEVDIDPATLRWSGRDVATITGGRASLVLPAGEHILVAQTEGHRDEQAKVTVIEGETSSVRVRFVPPPPEVLAPLPEPATEDDRASGISTRLALGYTGVGLGAALIAGGVFAAVDVQSKSDDADLVRYRDRLAPNQDACVEARAGTEIPGAPSPQGIADLCDSADTLTTLQYVFFGLGAAALGTGVYFLVSDDEPEATAERRPHLRARVGHDSAEVDLTIAF